MLPWLSSLSVSSDPVKRLRDWCSSRSLQISPLHREFPLPLSHSSLKVLNAVPQLSCGISHPTFQAAYGPFTPKKSEQRSPPLYYRGCWHRVSRGFLLRYYRGRMLFTPGTFSPHDRSLQPEGLHPPRGVASSGFPPLRKILDCSHP